MKNIPILHETDREYNERRATHLSSHWLAIFRQCPKEYYKRKSKRDTKAYALGRALHARVLEGGAVYESRYTIGGPINPKTGRPFGSDTKAFAEWAEQQGKPVLSFEQNDLVQDMACGIADNSNAVDLLTDGEAECVFRTTYCDMPCQIRVDWLRDGPGIVDVKTCEDLQWFESDAKRYGYVHQMAFYRAVLGAATGFDPLAIPVHLIAVEKIDPFRCGVWRVGEEALGIAQRENESAIRRLRECVAANNWPTGYEEVRVIETI